MPASRPSSGNGRCYSYFYQFLKQKCYFLSLLFSEKRKNVGKSQIQECAHAILKIHTNIANFPTPASKGYFKNTRNNCRLNTYFCRLDKNKFPSLSLIFFPSAPFSNWRTVDFFRRQCPGNEVRLQSALSSHNKYVAQL